MYCKKCGENLAENAKFCGKCGENVLDKNLSTAPQPPVKNENALKFTMIIKNILNLIPITLLIIAYGTLSSINHTANNLFIDGLNIIYFITIIMLIVEWVKNRKTGKKWFTRRFKVFIILISIIGIIVAIFSQALTLAREKTEVSKISDTQNTWQAFHSVPDNFDVQFPKYPNYKNSRDSSTSISFSTDSYTSYDDNATYYLYEYKYDTPLELTPEAALQASLNMMLNAVKDYHLSYSNFNVYDSHTSLDFLITNGTDNLKGRLIFLNQSAFVYMAVESDNINQINYDKFVNSFKTN